MKLPIFLIGSITIIDILIKFAYDIYPNRSAQLNADKSYIQKEKTATAANVFIKLFSIWKSKIKTNKQFL